MKTSDNTITLKLTLQEARWIAQCLLSGAHHLKDTHESLSAWARRCGETLEQKVNLLELKNN